jgi:hypothetical protein
MADFVTAQARLELTFKNLELLEESLTHRSYLNEHKTSKAHNERLRPRTSYSPASQISRKEISLRTALRS